MSLTVHKENARHRRAFAVWYEASRNFILACDKLHQEEQAARPGETVKRLPDRTLRSWAERFGWHDRADEMDVEAERVSRKAAIKRKADMLARHASVGKAIIGKAATYWAKQDTVLDKIPDALAAFRLGVEIERKAEGLPDWLVDLLGKDDAELVAEYRKLVQEIGGVDGGHAAAGNRPADPDAPEPGEDDSAPEDGG